MNILMILIHFMSLHAGIYVMTVLQLYTYEKVTGCFYDLQQEDQSHHFHDQSGHR